MASVCEDGMGNGNREDDDELEALRLAALRSCKSSRDTYGQVSVTSIENIVKPAPGRMPGYFPNNNIRNRLHHENNRNNFAGPKWGRPRSSNLIVINPVPLEQVVRSDPPPKLILPQDRWCPQTSIQKNEKNSVPDHAGPDKFSRIKCQSDDSDSDESESSEAEKSDNESDCNNSRSSVSGDFSSTVEEDSTSDFLVTQNFSEILSDCSQSDTETIKPENVEETISKPDVPDAVSTSESSEHSDDSVRFESSDVTENKDPSLLNNRTLLNEISVSSRTATGKAVVAPKTLRRDGQPLGEQNVPTKKPVDLREILKAKREVKDSSDSSSDDSLTMPLHSPIKSVLSVVRRSPSKTEDVRKKLNLKWKVKEESSKSKEKLPSRSVFLSADPKDSGHKAKLISDGMQVMVVTGTNDERKSSVHMRLGPKIVDQSPKGKVSVTSRLGLTPILDQKAEDNQHHLSAEGLPKERRRRPCAGNKRTRHSGFRGSKESELDAKIRRIERFNTARR